MNSENLRLSRRIAEKVSGPDESASENIAVFDGTDGKAVKDGGIVKSNILLHDEGTNDPDGITKNGFYRVYGAWTGTLVHTRWDFNYMMQIRNVFSTSEIQARFKLGGNWGSWITLWSDSHDVISASRVEAGEIQSDGGLSGAGVVYAYTDKCCVYSANNTVRWIGRYSGYFHLDTDDGAKGVTYWDSDERLKKNISDSTVNALDIIRQIKHRSFNKTNEDDKHYKLGYVAQELQALDDELVFDIKQPDGAEHDSILNINQVAIIPYLSKAIQEQQEIIEDLQSQICELKEGI